MRIVVTHGRGQAFERPAATARAWRDALIAGLEGAGLPGSDVVDIQCTFYGDIWRSSRRTRLEETLRQPPSELQQALAEEILSRNPADESQSWTHLSEIVARLDEAIRAGDVVWTRLLKDIDEYFSNPDVRETTLETARRGCLPARAPTILLAHGMGSIVAYDLLATDGAETLGVESLVTFGSPLGLRSVRKQMEWLHSRTPFPDRLRRWVDVADEQDVASVGAELSTLYRAHDGRQVEHVRAAEWSRDGRVGAPPPTSYLSSVAFGAAVRDLILPRAGAPSDLAGVPDIEARELVRGIGQSAPPPSGTRAVERTASADFPPVVAPGSTHELRVAIAGLAVHAQSESLVPLAVPLDQHELELRIGVYAADFDVRANDDPRRTWTAVAVDLEEPETVAEARFKLTAHEGEQRREAPIYVTVYRGNLPVGQLVLACVIDPRHQLRRASISVTIGGASDPEYVLVVTDRSPGLKGAGPFDIFVSKEGEFLNKPLGSFPVAVDAWQYASARLEGFRRAREEPTTGDRIRAAELLGVELWNDLPDDFKRFYWEELHANPGAAVAIYSQEPYIPWELIRPQRDAGGEEDTFLGAAFRIARWKQAVRFPDPLTVTGFSVIAPVYGPESGSRPLPGAQAEAQQLIAEFGAEPVLGERAVVREMLESSRGIQLIHFAGHGDFDPKAAEVSVIRLADSPFVPRDLSRARLGRTAHPFVFLNACEVGERGWALTKIGGWAEAFTDIGFSGFVGPYWAVNDRVARKSAVLFYRSLSAGVTVGEAIRQVRLQFYVDPDDAGHPSWLAYTLHCQPNIHIEMPAMATATSAGAAARSHPSPLERTDA